MMSFLPVEFEGNKDITAGRLEFESSEKLRELRQQHQQTHVFHRSGSDVFCIQLTENSDQIGEAFALSVEDSRIAERVIREALYKYLQNQSYLLIGFKPLILVDTSKNLLSECLSPEKQQITKGLDRLKEWLSQ